MLDVTVIILTFNEELHIKRCLQNVNEFAKRVYVIDSFSTDKTVETAESMGAVVVPHAWPGNQAAQFNWALNNIQIDTEWVLRLDADEYLLPELIAEMRDIVPSLPLSVTGITFKRRHIFCNYPSYSLFILFQKATYFSLGRLVTFRYLSLLYVEICQNMYFQGRCKA